MRRPVLPIVKLLVLVLALTFVLAAMRVPAAPVQAEGTLPPLEGFETVVSKDGLDLSLDPKTLSFVLRRVSDGAVWRSNPVGIDDIPVNSAKKLEMQSQLIVSYVDAETLQSGLVNSAVGCAKRGTASVETLPNGFRILYDFSREKESFRIPMEVTLEKGALVVAIPLSGIEQYGASARITRITVLPFLGAPSYGETASLFVPDGSGALIDANSGNARMAPYDQPIYGRDASLSTVFRTGITQPVQLPVFGILREQGGLLGIVEEGEGIGRIQAIPAGIGGGLASVRSSFVYRESDVAVLADQSWSAKDVTMLARKASDTGSYRLRYCLTEPGESGYTGLASKYRNFLMSEKDMARLSEPDPTLVVELLGAARKSKSFLGIVVEQVVPMTRFQQATEILGDFHEAGIANLDLRYTGWMNRGILDSVPISASPTRQLGGTSGLRSLLDSCTSYGYDAHLDIDPVQITQSRFGWWPAFSAARTIDLMPSYQYEYRKSTFLRNERIPPWWLLAPRFQVTVAERFTRSLSAFDGARISLSSLGRVLYSDFDPRHFSDRRQTAAALANAAAVYRAGSSDDLLVEGGAAYILPVAHTVLGIASGTSLFEVESQEIPFYEIALHGLVEYAYSPWNLSGDPTAIRLRSMETGAVPYFLFTAEDPSQLKDSRMESLYAAWYGDWKDETVSIGLSFERDLAGLADQFIVGHERRLDGLSITTYENGTRVIVNAGSGMVAFENRSLPAGTWQVIPQEVAR